MATPTTLSEVAAALQGAHNIAIVTHSAPDADAIGSALATYLALQSMGKNVAVFCDDPVPVDLRFVPGSDALQSALPAEPRFDLVVSLDASDIERLGEVGAALLTLGVPVANIDHHVTNLEFGDVNYVQPACAAAAEVLVSVFDATDVILTPDIATCLLTGLVGDTRSFSTASVTPATLMVAARLVEAGAPINAITDAVMYRKSYGVLRTWGIALSHLCLDQEVIWVTLPYVERAEKGVARVSGNGLSSLLLNAQEAGVSATFTETDNGEVEISFRARPGFDVATLALDLGGGGHPLAAGATIPGPLDEAAASVVERLKAQVTAHHEDESD